MTCERERLPHSSSVAACTGDGGFLLDPCAGHFCPSRASQRDVGRVRSSGTTPLQSETNRRLLTLPWIQLEYPPTTAVAYLPGCMHIC